MKRGEVWWASLPEPSRSGPGMRRPVLIVQANSFNGSRIATIVVATITSNLSLSEAPGNVRIGRAVAGLSKPSVVNVSQLLSADRTFLTERVGALPSQIMQRVDQGLKLVLSL